MKVISSAKVKEKADLVEDSGKEQEAIQQAVAVEEKEKEALKAAAAAEKAKYTPGDLKSFLDLADESTGNHKKFAKNPYLLDEFARTQRAQPPMMTHGLFLSILLFFLNIVTFLGGKGWSGPILPQKVERQPLFPLKLDTEKMKTLKTSEKLEFDANNHHIEILKSDIAQHNAQGVVGLKGIIIDGTRFDFGSLCGELTQKCGHDKAVEILSTISDFAMLSVTPDSVAAERKAFIEKQHGAILTSMEKSQSDLAAEAVFERSQDFQEPAPRRSGITVTAEEGQTLIKKIDKIHEDAKTYRPSRAARRHDHDDDVTMAPR